MNIAANVYLHAIYYTSLHFFVGTYRYTYMYMYIQVLIILHIQAHVYRNDNNW